MSSAFTEEQIDKYLAHISLPAQHQCTVSSIRRLDFEFLKALHAGQICCFPYENLTLHYSTKHPRVNIDPAYLYEKYMNNLSRGRGGYCFEGNIFFRHILAGLGFRVYTTGARVRPRKDGTPHGDYLGWVHCLNIVTLLDGSRYIVDVAFGGDGATTPLPLVEDNIMRNIGTQDMRLVRDYIPGQRQLHDEGQRLWIYQCRNGSEKPWNSFYAFSELEFLQQDFEVMNYFASNCTVGNFQTCTILAIKFLRRQHKVYGKVMLVNGDIKINDTGSTRLVKSCKTEQERIEALKEFFDICLSHEEINGIRGSITELNRT